MKIFVVSMSHPHGEGWNIHLIPHLEYLQKLIAEGILLASGPLKGTELRTGFLVIKAESREAVEAIVAGDPFAIEDLIVTLTIEEWDPLFGAFAAESSKTFAALSREEASRFIKA